MLRWISYWTQTGFCINDFRRLKLPRCIGVSCAFSYSALEGINLCRCSHVGAETQRRRLTSVRCPYYFTRMLFLNAINGGICFKMTLHFLNTVNTCDKYFFLKKLICPKRTRLWDQSRHIAFSLFTCLFLLFLFGCSDTNSSYSTFLLPRASNKIVPPN